MNTTPNNITTQPQPCLFPGCKKYRKTRGLCSNHYTTARLLVKNKLTTDIKLVKAGKWLTKRPGGPQTMGTVRAWFLAEEPYEPQDLTTPQLHPQHDLV